MRDHLYMICEEARTYNRNDKHSCSRITVSLNSLEHWKNLNLTKEKLETIIQVKQNNKFILAKQFKRQIRAILLVGTNIETLKNISNRQIIRIDKVKIKFSISLVSHPSSLTRKRRIHIISTFN